MSDSTPTYTSVEERGSYGVGLDVGKQLKSNPFEGMDPEIVAQGLIDSFKGNPPAVSHEDLEAAFVEIRKRMEGDAAEAGQKFLAENAKKDGIVVTESGLQYEVISEGSGEKPRASSTVSTHYHGTLIDGTVFDSSVQRGEPAEFPVNRVIAGWTEALQLMPVGSKWRLFVPYQLAYGERGAGGAIGPYQALIFEVELLAIV